MLPDNLQTGGAVLVVLGVGLQIVNVDVRQAREEQLQLLLVENGDQPERDEKQCRNVKSKSPQSYLRGMMS